MSPRKTPEPRPSARVASLTATQPAPLGPAFPPGAKLGEKYELRERIGRGGMGVVYRAEDTQLRRTVALKFLAPELAADPAGKKRFVNEARTASSLNHPNICTIYEVGEAAGDPYIAMEYVEGQPLDQAIPAAGLPFDEAVRYGAQIAAGLQHAHERAVVHRDLKAGNIVITPEGRAKILDFGLAKRIADADLGNVTLSQVSLTQEGFIAGTLPYLAPELLHGGSADARSDIWALGVVLYEMISGKRPFEGRTGFALTSSILRDAPAPLPPATPVALGAVILKCLDKDRELRFRTAGDVRKALEGLRPAGGPDVRRRFRKAPWLLAAAGLVAVGLVVASGLLPVRPKSRAAADRPVGETAVRPSPNAAANEYFEKSMIFLRTQFDLPQARRMLEKALEFDPAFAEARAWYGFTFVIEIDSGLSNDSGLLYQAERELRQALRDDPDCAPAHAKLAALCFFQGRKELAPDEARKALAIDPNEPDAKIWLANYYTLNGDYAEAKELVSQVLLRDPLFFPARMNLADMLREEGDPAAAGEELGKILEQDPRNLFALQRLAILSLDRGETDQARRLLEEIPSPDQASFGVRLNWALLLAMEGKPAEARTAMGEECLKYASLSVFWTSVAAEIYAQLGEPDKALDWLERAVRNGDDRAAWFRRDPLLAKVRDQPRFGQILESIDYRLKTQKL